MLPKYRARPTPTRIPAVFATSSMLFARPSSTPERVDDAPTASFAPPTHARKAFCTFCADPLIDAGRVSNSLRRISTLVSSGTILLVVSSPLLAIFRRPPTVVPSPSASSFARRPPFSMMELNSSPRKTPEPSAWLSWVITELASSVLAPDSFSEVATVSVTFATSAEA